MRKWFMLFFMLRSHATLHDDNYIVTDTGHNLTDGSNLIIQ